MKSIQTKIISLIVLGITVSVILIGGIGTHSFKKAMQEECVAIMNLTCGEKVQELDNVLLRMEQAVEILSEYVIDNLDSVEKLQNDQQYRKEYLQELEELGLTIVTETEGAIAIYTRFNPDLVAPKAGFYWNKNLNTGKLEREELTDLTQYEKDDIGRVGWYYIPVEAGHAVWISPYFNENVNVYMISYVIPIYQNKELTGVVGMDIDFSFLTEKIDLIHVYDTGHAFLTDEDFMILHSAHLGVGTSVKALSEELSLATADELKSDETIYSYNTDHGTHRVAFGQLCNGMYLAVTAPDIEVNEETNRLAMQITLISGGVVLFFIFVTIGITTNIVRPLKELDQAAKEIAKGNLDITLKCRTNDEVGTLTESIKTTAKQLKVRIDYINNLAYLDKLTGIQNNTAYLREVASLKEELNVGVQEFAIFVVDVNGLKRIYDMYGHDYGNELIIAASKVTVNCFGYENVYRMGGDEFVVIMRNLTITECKEYEKEFLKQIEEFKGKIKLSAAIGSAVYDSVLNETYEGTFKRADAEMYVNKQRMKADGATCVVEEA